ncbi:galactokinase [Gryllotalpicola protaetiae]|uniref:Galactokinase n=1 Tax=Gryllotalpicola protaetiae TaxID=2419771 RepID=A0A387BX09_9MICO|nr:galactokinase [Gryllotalpicola protaetiae]AYG02871.1 galactokinase [Gryllotalpicola protaetiae]
MSSLVDETAAGFEKRFSYAPSGIWSAPGRVNLIGEHTDYNEGFVLPFAIDRRTFAALALRDDDVVRVSSASGDQAVEVRLADAAAGPASLEGIAEDGRWAAYPLGVVWALGQLGADLAGLPGFDVYFESDVPIGAGLSSSAAIEGALAVALNEVWRLGFDDTRLVDVCHRAENDFVGAPTGILDQSAALLSQEGAALFLDCRDGSSEPVDLALQASDLAILVIDTKVRHEHVSGGYAERRAACETAARELGVRALRDVAWPQLLAARDTLDGVVYRRARHIVTEDQRVLDTVAALRAQDYDAVGDLMFASHRSMRDDFEISTPELDLAVEISLNYGAIGARMTGGGFGGSVIALTPVSAITQVQVAIDGAFAEHGYAGPEMFLVWPSQGARRDR